MSDLGQFQGQWLGKWHGGVEELAPGFGSGHASFSINAFGTLSVANAETPVVVGGGIREYTFEQAQREWDNKRKWVDESARWADVTPMSVNVPSEAVEVPVVKDSLITEIPLDEIVSRLDTPLLSLAELLADAKLLQLEQAQALEAAMAVRDVMRIAELAYLAELAVQQEKDAIVAFLMFMD